MNARELYEARSRSFPRIRWEALSPREQEGWLHASRAATPWADPDHDVLADVQSAIRAAADEYDASLEAGDTSSSRHRIVTVDLDDPNDVKDLALTIFNEVTPDRSDREAVELGLAKYAAIQRESALAGATPDQDGTTR